MSAPVQASRVRAGPIASLDGIRAVAVSLVFFAHGGFEDFVPGGLGVTIFFVLSGFLITTLMRIEYAQQDCLRLRDFYLRRLLRLMPPLAIVVGLAGLLAAASVIDGGFTVGGLLAALFYAGNYYVIAHDFNGLPAGLGVVWSLAIEEHYYLLFPPLAALLLHARSAALSRTVLLSLCAAVLAWRCWLAGHGGSAAYLMMATDTRVDAILVGCLMALTCNPWLDRRPGSAAPGDLALAVAAVALLIGTLVYRDEQFRLTARYSLQSLAIAALIYLAVARAHQRPFRWLNARPLAYLGSISYTIYLSHHVILRGLARHWPHWDTWQLMAVGAVLTLALAIPMRRWVEQPCARLRRRLHRTGKATAPPAGLAAADAS
jgi:peptidoglycan/LPS O-acetylase OafA/YrhL